MSNLFFLPDPIKTALSLLEKNGFEAYLVGGCVRDFLLSKTPYDFDITTNAHPKQMKSCFQGYPVFETGLKHGTLTVRIDKMNIEVTTYRIDGTYKDSRHPDKITFTSSLAEDLKRRDFTVNAMAYNEKCGLIDLFYGQEHLKRRLICSVGESKDRFREDALRIVRAIRFACVLGFTIEENTSLAIHETKELLKKISRERIFSELCKALLGENPGSILSEYLDVITVILPEFFLAEKDAVLTGFSALSHCKAEKTIRLAAFLYALTTVKNEPDAVRQALKSLKADNKTVSSVSALLLLVPAEIAPDRKSMLQLCAKLGFDGAADLLNLKAALFPDTEPLIQQALTMVEQLKKENACISLNMLAVNGHDVLDAGIKDKKKIGYILKTLFESVIEGTLVNDRDILLEEIEKLLNLG